MTFNESFIIGISKSPGNNNKNVHSPYTLSIEIKRLVYSFAWPGIVISLFGIYKQKHLNEEYSIHVCSKP